MRLAQTGPKPTAAISNVWVLRFTCNRERHNVEASLKVTLADADQAAANWTETNYWPPAAGFLRRLV